MTDSDTTPAKESLVVTAMALDAEADAVEAFIRQTVPGVSAVAKYGGTLFTLFPDQREGQFCGVFVYNHHVQISFSRGAGLADPQGMLLGTGKRRRHVNFTQLENLDLEYLGDLLVQASAGSSGNA
ncbi:MAG: DUF1801 domain-containing protein [Pseudomonadota bacterium]